jgi:hypothetical protein
MNEIYNDKLNSANNYYLKLYFQRVHMHIMSEKGCLVHYKSKVNAIQNSTRDLYLYFFHIQTYFWYKLATHIF